MMTRRGERTFDALALVLLKLVVAACVLRAGFSHVSDDDYARTVISEQFARAPRLDPSGTSWLPAPFWLEGGVMLVLGRSLGVARAVAVALGAASVAAPYVAMRAAGMRRVAALLATAFAMTTPWNAWLGVATVPEGWVSGLVAAAMITMPVAAARPWAAAGLLLGALSRYETWPVCGVMVVLCAGEACRQVRREARQGAVWQAGRDAVPRDRRPVVHRQLACAAVALAGPAAWMLWNAHAHGSALHFIARVTSFRQSIGAAAVPVTDKLLGYPRALVLEMPVAAAFAVAAGLGLLSRPTRERWTWPLVAAGTTLGFLIWGDVHDGAPTHHAARALVAIGWVLVAAGVDAVFALQARPGASGARGPIGAVVALATVAGVAAVAGRPTPPGQTEPEDRAPQIARGLSMRARGVRSATLVPCAFEHFALLAAWGAPERATVLPRTGQPPTPRCPQVSEP